MKGVRQQLMTPYRYLEMLNQIILVGRIVKNPELKETESGKKVSTFNLAVPRSYKNAEGEYDTDFINCVLYSNIAESTVYYCKKGDLIGLKGRVQTNKIEENGIIKDVMEIIAEKVTYLHSQKEDTYLKEEE